MKLILNFESALEILDGNPDDLIWATYDCSKLVDHITGAQLHYAVLLVHQGVEPGFEDDGPVFQTRLVLCDVEQAQRDPQWNQIPSLNERIAFEFSSKDRKEVQARLANFMDKNLWLANSIKLDQSQEWTLGYLATQESSQNRKETTKNLPNQHKRPNAGEAKVGDYIIEILEWQQGDNHRRLLKVTRRTKTKIMVEDPLRPGKETVFRKATSAQDQHRFNRQTTDYNIQNPADELGVDRVWDSYTLELALPSDLAALSETCTAETAPTESSQNRETLAKVDLKPGDQVDLETAVEHVAMTRGRAVAKARIHDRYALSWSPGFEPLKFICFSTGKRLSAETPAELQAEILSFDPKAGSKTWEIAKPRPQEQERTNWEGACRAMEQMGWHFYRYEPMTADGSVLGRVREAFWDFTDASVVVFTTTTLPDESSGLRYEEETITGSSEALRQLMDKSGVSRYGEWGPLDEGCQTGASLGLCDFSFAGQKLWIEFSGQKPQFPGHFEISSRAGLGTKGKIERRGMSASSKYRVTLKDQSLPEPLVIDSASPLHLDTKLYHALGDNPKLRDVVRGHCWAHIPPEQAEKKPQQTAAKKSKGKPMVQKEELPAERLVAFEVIEELELPLGPVEPPPTASKEAKKNKGGRKPKFAPGMTMKTMRFPADLEEELNQVARSLINGVQIPQALAKRLKL